MELLKGYMVTNAGDGDVVSYIYNEINGKTGELVSKNKRGSFYPIDEEGRKLVEDMKKYIQETRLNQEG